MFRQISDDCSNYYNRGKNEVQAWQQTQPEGVRNGFLQEHLICALENECGLPG